MMQHLLWMNRFSRYIALLLVVTVTALSCSFPAGTPGETEPRIIPGEGNAHYVYLDDDGRVVETDEGITGFFIENNANAAGTVVVSIDTEISSQDTLVLVRNQNNDSTVSMRFKYGKDFPYEMTVNQGTDKWFGYLSLYRSQDSSYDITFQKDGHSETLRNCILNRDIFSLYQNDVSLSASQNLRLKNITVALGLWGSLAASMTETPVTGVQLRPGASLGMERGFFLGFFSGVIRVFTAVSVVAATVAYVAVPIDLINDSTAGLVIAEANKIVIPGASVLTGFVALSGVVSNLDREDPVMGVERISVNADSDENWFNGEEFHMGRGSDVLFNFSSPGLDNTGIGPIDAMYWIYEPGVLVNTSNAVYFERSLEKDTNRGKDAFQVRIKRKPDPGYNGDGKVSFGFKFPDPVIINDKSDGVMFKTPQDQAEVLHKDLVVIRFCINPACPQYRD